MKVKIRKGDLVEIISGKLEDKGRRGEVIKVMPDDHRVVVQGINIHTKHQRQVESQGRTLSPGMLKFEAPIDISHVMKVCPKCNKPTRIAISRDGDKVQRICKKCSALMDE